MTKVLNFNPFFQYYPGNIQKCKPQGRIDLAGFIRSTRSPKDVKIFELIFEAETRYQTAKAAGNRYQAAGDDQQAAYWKQQAAHWKGIKDRLKQNLHYFTPCVWIHEWRAYRNIQRFTGLAVLDFDHLSFDQAKELKENIFQCYSVICCAYLSPSRHGVKALIRVPVVSSVEEFQLFYSAIIAEFSQYPGFDPTNKNPGLPLFRSYDPDILSRTDPETWDIKADPPPKITPAPITLPSIQQSDSDLKWKGGILLKQVADALSRIGDIHHPRIRQLAKRYAGYIPKYYSEGDLLNVFEQAISADPYMLAKKTTYLGTVRTFIQYGRAEPCEPNIAPRPRPDVDQWLGIK